jgi:hypothetical protein
MLAIAKEMKIIIKIDSILFPEKLNFCKRTPIFKAFTFDCVDKKLLNYF